MPLIAAWRSSGGSDTTARDAFAIELGQLLLDERDQGASAGAEDRIAPMAGFIMVAGLLGRAGEIVMRLRHRRVVPHAEELARLGGHRAIAARDSASP